MGNKGSREEKSRRGVTTLAAESASNGRGSPPPRPSTAPRVAAGTAPCKYFLSGYCRQGQSCTFAHTLPSDGSPAFRAPSSGSATRASQEGATTPSKTSQASSSIPSSPSRVKIRSEEQAVLLAMLASLKDSLENSKSQAEKASIQQEIKRTMALYKAEHERIKEERRAREEQQEAAHARARASSQPQPSPLRNVTFPTFNYAAERHGGREDKSEDRQECAICIASYEEDDEIMVLPCLHWFHSRCGGEWLQKKTECPLCQNDVMKSVE